MAHGTAYEKVVEPLKYRLFSQVRRGDAVLEAGIGTAPNLRFYADKVCHQELLMILLASAYVSARQCCHCAACAP